MTCSFDKNLCPPSLGNRKSHWEPDLMNVGSQSIRTAIREFLSWRSSKRETMWLPWWNSTFFFSNAAFFSQFLSSACQLMMRSRYYFRNNRYEYNFMMTVPKNSHHLPDEIIFTFFGAGSSFHCSDCSFVSEVK